MLKKFLAGGAACLFVASPAYAAMSSETSFVLNSLLMLLCGALVMFMAAGFTMLEAGSVRSKSVGVILTKNISLYAIAGITFYVIGYNIMFAPGTPGTWIPDDTAALGGDLSSGHAANAYWFFQMVFVATAASVVSGALAERSRFWPFLTFAAILTGIIYPVVGSWTWGGGWLARLGFTDFAGSTVVHSVGGWAALAGALLLGPRTGRFCSEGRPKPLPGSSAPQVAIGVLILWFGWLGFNGGSQLSLSSVEDAIAISNIFANTNAAAAGGVLAVLLATQLLFRRPNLMLTLNGALAGLVAITAEPSAPSISAALLIGAGGGLVMLVAAWLLESFRIDDVVGAVPVHLAAGIWGTVVASVTNEGASLSVQLFGVASIGAFVFVLSFLIWWVMRLSFGIRLDTQAEEVGADLAEMGTRAYNFDFIDALLPSDKNSLSSQTTRDQTDSEAPSR
ncbi:ammonium transporter family protein [Kordiimonas aestuarii]|uniref:ammonium transporter n=1 Tax=Kordiimonas aestuarii TaxID=1005925 RepID=UPI0021D26431|nr:ammonium transporter [Kordiimonas aestuarii]